MSNKLFRVSQFTYNQILVSKWYLISTIIGILGVIGSLNLNSIYNKFLLEGTDEAQVAMAQDDLRGIIPLLVVVVLFMLILIYGANIANSIIEEKSSRIIETLLCYVNPTELLTGKIVAYIVAVVQQIAFWGILRSVGGLIVKQPDSGVKMSDYISGPAMALIVASIVLGFMMYAYAFAALASYTDNSQDTTQLVLPVILTMMIVYFIGLAQLRGATSPVITVITYLPFALPILGLTVSDLHTITLTTALILIAVQVMEVIVVGGICAKMYRRGVVSYGIKKRKLWKVRTE